MVPACGRRTTVAAMLSGSPCLCTGSRGGRSYRLDYLDPQGRNSYFYVYIFGLPHAACVCLLTAGTEFLMSDQGTLKGAVGGC